MGRIRTRDPVVMSEPRVDYSSVGPNGHGSERHPVGCYSLLSKDLRDLGLAVPEPTTSVRGALRAHAGQESEQEPKHLPNILLDAPP